MGLHRGNRLLSPLFTRPDWAEVYTESGTFIAKGWYDEKSHIVLHLLTWDKDEVTDDDFVEGLVVNAIRRRKDFFTLENTNCFRLIHGEADFIPGLAADCYAQDIHLILSSRFALHFLPVIIKTLEKTLHPSLVQVSADAFYASSEGISEKVRYFKKGVELKDSEAPKDNSLFMESGIWYEITPVRARSQAFIATRETTETERRSTQKVNVFSTSVPTQVHSPCTLSAQVLSQLTLSTARKVPSGIYCIRYTSMKTKAYFQREAEKR